MSVESWRTCLLPDSASVQDAIQCLDRSGLQIALVVDNEERLVGTITDGDIRRGLLRGLDMGSVASAIVQRNPLIVPPELPVESVLQLMHANKIHQLPVVNDAGRIVGLHLWDELQTSVARLNTMVIMAGGKGTRLRPYTDECPKPLLPVGGKPILQHIIERARDEGFSDFTVAVHHLGHMIEDHFGDGRCLGVRIEYLREPSPLGTGGALSLLSPRPDRPFLVTNGDVLTDVRYGDLLDFHERHGALATMAVRAHEWQHPFGVVQTEGMDIIGFNEKPIMRSHVNGGIYVLDPGALEFLEPGAVCDMPALFDRLRAVGHRTIVYPMHEPWLDVGRPDDLESARNSHAAPSRDPETRNE
jgi:dTDP-glucose pyrophosphorylase